MSAMSLLSLAESCGAVDWELDTLGSLLDIGTRYLCPLLGEGDKEGSLGGAEGSSPW